MAGHRFASYRTAIFPLIIAAAAAAAAAAVLPLESGRNRYGPSMAEFLGGYLEDGGGAADSIAMSGDNVNDGRSSRQTRRGLDSLPGAISGQSERLRSIDSRLVPSNVRRPGNADEVAKRNIDEIDRTAFDSFFKRNFDEIDRVGWSGFVKRFDRYLADTRRP